MHARHRGRPTRRRRLAAVAVAAGLGFARSACAAITLLNPPPRYPLVVDAQRCPCGGAGGPESCDGQSRDSRRSARVSRFEVGSELTLRFNETIDETGRLRVAFDRDGADMADFNANVLADVADPYAFGGLGRTITVTLPATPCSNCTLQLVQAATGIADRPVADPSSSRAFYTCVDLELVPVGALEAMAEPAEPSSSAADAGAPEPSGSELGAPPDAGALVSEPRPESQGTLNSPESKRAAGSAGCSLASVPTMREPWVGWGCLWSGWLAWMRRCRRSRQQAAQERPNQRT